MAGLRATPCKIHDMSLVHEASLPWTVTEEGHLHATGFNDHAHPVRANHACVDLVYELESPGAIAYAWKVRGRDAQGAEAFDRYWYLRGEDGMLLSGEDFLGEDEEFAMHLIEGLDAGTYTLTVGVFCMAQGGSVTLDLTP